MMRTLFRILALAMLACIVLSVIGGGALMHEIWSDGVHISVDGDEVFGASGAFDGLGALLGVLIAGLVLCVVLPLVLLFSIGLPLLIVGCIVAALLSAGAVACSPFILFVLLMVWLLRRNKPRRVTRRNEPNIAA